MRRPGFLVRHATVFTACRAAAGTGGAGPGSTGGSVRTGPSSNGES